MKLFYSPASPFVRKVLAAAIELGLDGRIERLPSAVGPINRDQAVVAKNPLGQVPTVLLDDGTPLYDSRVVCEYLDVEAGGGRLFPAAGPARWRALTEQSVADGLLDAAVLGRYELLRPAEIQWPTWRQAQMAKITGALDQMQAWAPELGDRVDIGTITMACALGYLDFRYADLDWRSSRPALAAWYAAFAKRPSMAATVPSAP